MTPMHVDKVLTYMSLVCGPAFAVFLFVLLRHRYLMRDLLDDDRKSESSGKHYELRAANVFNPGANMFHVRFGKRVAVKLTLTMIHARPGCT